MATAIVNSTASGNGRSGCLSGVLQIALHLLTCGMSQCMWSVSTSVAGVVTSSTVLGRPFYTEIAVAEMPHQCPFQTPASQTLAGQPGDRCQACFCSTPSRSSTSLVRTPRNCWWTCLCQTPPEWTPCRGSFRHPAVFSTTSSDTSSREFLPSPIPYGVYSKVKKVASTNLL